MRIALKQSRLGLLNSTTRIPFRYGNTCLTRCPQAVLEVVVEVDGQQATGYSGDCLPPGWFDKTPGKEYRTQIQEMLAAIDAARQAFATRLRTAEPFFPAWLEVDDEVHRQFDARQLPGLLAGFGVSLVERAIMDAAARSKDLPFHQLIAENLLEIDPATVHPELAGRSPRDWLPTRPASSIFVRHTVGLADPLTAGEIPADERLDDGFPQALEEYVAQNQIRYFKIKVSNRLELDLDRLRTIARIVERQRHGDYRVTLDGNEQYKQAEQFDELMTSIRADPNLKTLLANTLVVEQPLERSIALAPEQTRGIRELGESLPVIIDESDGSRDAYRQAIELGYRGISSKSCKGVVRSLLNAGLTWHFNEQGRQSSYVVTGEDLCSVGVVPVQSDLCLVATLGLEHVERNGHHYHPGLSYLPAHTQQAALHAHPDLYAPQHGRIAPRVIEGRFEIESLQCPGLGFAVLPEMTHMTPANEWEFASLGLGVPGFAEA